MASGGTDRVHNSKVDNWLLLLVVTLAIFSLLITTLLSLRGWLVLGLPVLLAGAVLPMWVIMNTRYRISNDELRIWSGPFRWRVPLADITSVTPCHNSLPAPALSRERLKLSYGPGYTLIVSPQDRYQFILDLGVADPETD